MFLCWSKSGRSGRSSFHRLERAKPYRSPTMFPYRFKLWNSALWLLWKKSTLGNTRMEFKISGKIILGYWSVQSVIFTLPRNSGSIFIAKLCTFQECHPNQCLSHLSTMVEKNSLTRARLQSYLPSLSAAILYRTRWSVRCARQRDGPLTFKTNYIDLGMW